MLHSQALIILYMILLNFYQHLFISPTPSAWQPLFYFLFLWGLIFFFFSDFTCKWYHAVFVFLWLILLNIMPSKSIHVVLNGRIIFFLTGELYSTVCVCVYTELSSFTEWNSLTDLKKIDVKCLLRARHCSTIMNPKRQGLWSHEV